MPYRACGRISLPFCPFPPSKGAQFSRDIIPPSEGETISGPILSHLPTPSEGVDQKGTDIIDITQKKAPSATRPQEQVNEAQAQLLGVNRKTGKEAENSKVCLELRKNVEILSGTINAQSD